MVEKAFYPLTMDKLREEMIGFMGNGVRRLPNYFVIPFLLFPLFSSFPSQSIPDRCHEKIPHQPS
jgi:hypothetical protein